MFYECCNYNLTPQHKAFPFFSCVSICCLVVPLQTTKKWGLRKGTMEMSCENRWIPCRKKYDPFFSIHFHCTRPLLTTGFTYGVTSSSRDYSLTFVGGLQYQTLLSLAATYTFQWQLKKYLLHKWFLTGGRASPGGFNNFPGGTSPYALYNMESLTNKLTIKYICFQKLFKVRGLETKRNFLRETW